MKKLVPRFAAHNPPMALWVFTAALLAACIAHGFQVGDLYYTTPDDNNCVSVTGSALAQPVNVAIPSSVTYSWTEWQEDRNGVRHLITNSVVCSVTGVSNNAFREKHTLKTVSFSNGLLRIGCGAFSECTSIGSVSFPQTLRVLDCYGHDIPYHDGWGAFQGCTALSNIVFNGCSPIIGERVFAGCSSLTGIDIPGSVTNIGAAAFSESGIRSIVLPDGLTFLSPDLFAYCESLERVTFGENTKRIGHCAFAYCSSLQSLTLPNGLKEIGDSWSYYAAPVFVGCTSLTNISIPRSVELITRDSFSGCGNLPYDTTTMPGLVLLDGYVVGYTGSFAPVNGHLDLSPAKGMVDGAFSGCEELRSVRIPETWTRIPNYAFEDCCNLTNIVIPSSVTRIGGGAFAGCYGFSELSIPANVTELGFWAFVYTAFDEIVIPNGVEVIPEMFCGPSGIKKVTIGTGVKRIDEAAFRDCFQLSKIVFLGDAPSEEDSCLDETDGHSFAFTCAEYTSPDVKTVYVSRGSTGWNTEIPGTWHGMRIEYLPLAEDPGAYEIHVRGDGTALQEAIERAPAGATLLVARGTYTPIWTQGKSLHIKAVEGPEVTIIDGNNTNRCATLSTSPDYGQNTSTNTVLDGFTLLNGAAYPYDTEEPMDRAGGVYGGTVQNCVIRQCSSIWGSGASDSVLRNTMIVDCHADDYATVFECDLENCLVANNSVDHWPAGLFNCYAVNCTIASNLSEEVYLSRFDFGGQPLSFNGTHYWLSGGGSVGVTRGFMKNCIIFENFAYRAPFSTYDPVTDTYSETYVYDIGPLNYASCMLERCFTMPVPVEELLYSDDEDGLITTGWHNSRKIPCHFEPGQCDDESATPRFVDERSGDFRLRFDSPCIDAGKSVPLSGDADLGGSPRVVGRAIDIGCYEFQRMIDVPSEEEGAVAPASVPMDFIDEKAAPILVANDGDYEAAAMAKASNGVNKVWECYVAGISPTNATDMFRTVISIGADGKPEIGWEPDLNEGGTKHERVYTVEGRESLTEGSWGSTNAASRFFHVKVSMP